MILESLVTTVSAAGRPNLAPMGPAVQNSLADDPGFTLKPFTGSTTHDNLIATGRAVIHVTDDVRLIARSAVGRVPDLNDLATAIDEGPDVRLIDCCRWYAVDVTRWSGDPPRRRAACRVTRSGWVRPFFGFNRAKHAVIEASILATRTHLIPRSEISRQFARLAVLVDKTGGGAEHEAFELLRRVIDEPIPPRPSTR